MSYVLGIDLGTTNTVVAVAEETEVRVLRNQEGNLLLPSVVSFHPDGSVLIGEGARERRLIDAENTVYSVKRLIGRQFRSPEVQRAKERFAFPLAEGPSGGVRVQVRGETYTLTEISAFVLRKAREQAEIALGDKAQQAVITVPANFNELQRSATKAAGLVAGLEVLRIINEPTAAALAYGCGKGTRERIAIYDLGGGTFDLTILDLDRDVFEVLSTAGDTFLGGDDFDVALADKMADAFLSTHNWDPRQDRQAFERLRAAAEWAKCRLSEDTEVELTIEELAYGPGGQPLDLTWSTTRKDLEDLIHPTVGRSFDVCNDAFKLAALKPQDLDKVILVGGSTRIPLVKRMVSEFFGKQPLVDIDPDLVVAQGAAIHARAIAGVPKGRQRRKSLGKVALKRVSGSQLRPAAAEMMDRPKQPAFAPTPAAHAPPPVARAPVPPPPAPSRTRKSSGRGSKGINERITPPPSAVIEPPLVALDDSSDDIGDFQESKTGVFGPEVLTGMHPKVEDGPSVIVDDQQLLKQPDPKRTAKLGGTPMSKVKTDPGHVAKIEPVVLRDPNPRSNPPPPPPGAAAAPPPPPPAAIPSALIAPGPVTPIPPTTVERRQIAPGSPLLMDVTPHSLGIETTGGYCQLIIHRNAPVPTEQMRVFTTARDNQEVVYARICQGESRRFEENETLGQLELHNLRSATRGEVKIEVAFMLDASGTLDVRATDVGTGQAQSVRINLLGGTSTDELDQMRSRQEAAMTR